MKKLNIGIFKVLSLAVGLAVGLVLIAKISFESSYDKFYPEYKDTYCIMQEYTNANANEGSDTYGQTPGAVAYYMGQEIPQVKYATRVTGIGIGTCNVFDQEQHKYTAENIILADTNYFKVFPRPFLTGDPVEVLSTWNKAMVSRTFAEKFGGVDQAVGKIFFLEDWQGIPIEVGGIFEDIPENASLRFDIAISLEAMDELLRMMGSDFRSTQNWVGNDRYISRVVLYPGTDPASLDQAIRDMENRYLPVEELQQAGLELHFTLAPLSSTHSSSESIRRTNLLLGVVAAALILAAVMNYIMIVISSLIGRAKGIAVRRCYGAGGGTIMGIVFKETLINLAVSLVLAFLLILAFRNTVESIMMTSLGALFSPHSLWVLALTVVVVLLIAAYIPGRAFQSIPIAVAFRNYVDNKRLWKRILLFLQMALASLLITLLCFVALQMDRWMSDDPGYDYEQLLSCPLNGIPAQTRTAIMQAVSTVPGVTAVGTADHTLATGSISGNNIYLPGDPRELFNIGDLYNGCPEWAELVGADIIEGRNFSNPKEIIVDPDFRDRLVEVTGWTDGVIGKQVLITEHSQAGDDLFTIVGVFSDIRVGTVIDEDSRPNVLFYSDEPCGNLIVRTDQVTPELTAAIQNAVESVVPDRFTVLPYTAIVTETFRPAKTLRESILVAGAVTIVIALIGLIGYTTDETGRRRKEIALRKINGAQPSQITAIFLRDIGTFSVVAVAIGSVASWFVFQMVLRSFAQKATVSVWLFIAVAAILLAVLAAVVIARCYDIARSNPADSLRAE